MPGTDTRIHSMQGTFDRSTRDRMGFSERSRLSDRVAYLARRQAELDGQSIPPMRQSYELSQIDPSVVPTREAPPVTLPGQSATSPSRPRRRSHQSTTPIEQPPLNPRGIDRGPDIIPPFVSHVEETHSTPPTIIYMDGQQVDPASAAPFIEYIEDRRRQEEQAQIDLQRDRAEQIAQERQAQQLAAHLRYQSRGIVDRGLVPEHFQLSARDQSIYARAQEFARHRRQIFNLDRNLGRWMSGDDTAITDYEPELRDLERDLDGRGPIGSFAGIGLGLVLTLREMITGFSELMGMIITSRWANREDYVDALNTMRDLLMSEIRDQGVSRQIANILYSGFQSINEMLDRIYEDSAQGHLVRPAAEITQITIAIIDMIDAVHGVLTVARHSPEMLIQLQSTSRRLRASIREIGVPQTGDAEFTRFVRELYRDEQGSLILGSSRGKNRSPQATRGRSLPSVASHEQLQASVRARRIRDFDTEWASNFTRQYELERTHTGALRVRDRRIPTMAFREWALDRILASPNHPLAVLIDPASGNFLRPNRRYPNLADHFTGNGIEMGHTVSRHAGGEERLALQWSYSNQLDARTLEALSLIHI